MVRETERELLTAFIDGECSEDEQKAVMRLLQRSSEARKLLRQLQQDADSLRTLPRMPSPRDFSQSVLDTIEERGLRPGRFRRTNLPPVPLWTTVAAAASVFLAVGLATFFFSVAKREENKGGSTPPGGIVKRDQDPKRDDNPVKPPVKEVSKDKGDKPGKPVVVPPIRVAIKPGAAIDQPLAVGKGGPVDTIVTAPKGTWLDAEIAQVAIPEAFHIYSLSRKENRERLLSSIHESRGSYVEIISRDAHKALSRVQAACRSLKIPLHVDQLAKLHQKKGKARVDYVIYLEHLTGKEIAALMDQIRLEDVKLAKKRRSDAVLFDVEANLILTALTSEHRRKMQALVGSELRRVENQPAEPTKIDLSRPLSEQTREHVEKALSRKIPGRHSGLAMIYNLTLPRARVSVEIQKFLAQRKPLPKASRPLMLVIRSK